MSFKLFFRYLNVGILAVVFILLASMFLTSSKAHAIEKASGTKSDRIYKIDLQQDRSQSRVHETMRLIQWLSQQSSVATTAATVPVTLATQYFPAYNSAVNMRSQFIGYWFAVSESSQVFVGLEETERSSIYILSVDTRGSWSLWLPDSDLRYSSFLSFVKRTLQKPMVSVAKTIACRKMY